MPMHHVDQHLFVDLLAEGGTEKREARLLGGGGCVCDISMCVRGVGLCLLRIIG